MGLGFNRDLKEVVTLGGIHNLTATTDPTTANDISQGYQPGSVWFNITLSRVWMCLSNAAGAATWFIDGVVPGVGYEPANMLTQFGGGTTTFFEEGNIYRHVVGTAINPGATGSDYVVDNYAMAANSFDIAGRGLNILAMGSFAANTNAKTVKIVVGATNPTVGQALSGGTVIANGTANTVATGGGWQLIANIFKYGATGSNTQLALHESFQSGNAVGALVAPQLLTLAENGVINITIAANAATTASDVGLFFTEINAMN